MKRYTDKPEFKEASRRATDQIEVLINRCLS